MLVSSQRGTTLITKHSGATTNPQSYASILLITTDGIRQ